MLKKTLYLLIGLALIVTIFAACQQTPTVQPTPAPSATPRPTSTPVPPRPVIPYTPVPADALSPIVIDRVPRRGEDMAPDGVVQISFDKQMDTTSVEGAFSIQAAGDDQAIDGTFTWIDERTLEFTPQAELPRNTVYDVILTQEAQADQGEMLREPFTFRFATAGYLEVTQVIPADGTVETEADSTITVMFNKPVVPLTNLDAMDTFPNPLQFTPELSGKGEWLNTSIYVFTPDALAGGTQYQVSVKAGLEDLTGAVLANDYTWNFTTIPPRVTWTTPGEDETLVRIDTDIRITFNQPVDPASAERAFSLKASGFGGGTVRGEFKFDGGTLTFTPNKPLDFNTTYICEIAAGVTSVAGGIGMIDRHTWQFQTVPLPRIISTYPKHLERQASPYTDFRIEFNTPIDPETVMPNLTMTPPITITEVYTYFSWWDNTFVLSFGAQPSTEYIVEIDDGIADPYGNTIPEGRTVRFTTAPLPPFYQLHTPDSIGTYDATKPAQLVVGYVNLERIDFSLYRVPQDVLNEPYWDWRDERPSGSRLLREWRESLDAPENQQQYALINLSDSTDGTLEPGVYLLEADSPDLDRDEYQRRQVHVLVVSNLNMTLKASPDNALVWVTDLISGEPVPNLNLTLREVYGGRQMTQITTGADGVAMVDLDSNHDSLIVTSTEPFGAVAEGWERGISPWDFGIGEGRYDQGYQTYIYTDRPIYRAGQTTHFKGVVRAEDDAIFSMPNLANVNVSIRDAAWEEIFTEQLALSTMGTFEGSVDLDENAALGDYAISVSFQNHYDETYFQVAEYRPPEFELTVDTDPDATLRGEDVDAVINASYFFGGPLGNLDVSWNVIAQPYTFSPSWAGRYSFDDPDDPFYRCFWCWWEPPAPTTALISGQGTTDANGQLAFTVQGTDLNDNLGKGAQRITIEGVATGPDNQAIAGRGGVIVHPGSYYIGLSPQKYVSKADEESLIDVVAVDWESQRLPNTQIELSLYRYEWINTFVENEYGGGSWEWDTDEVFIESVQVTTDNLGEAVAGLTPPTGGSYRVVAQAANPTAKTEHIRTSIFIWVAGEDTIAWRRENHDRINLISSQETYQVGDVAEILIPSPFEGPQTALITVERGSVRRYEVLHFSSNSAVYQLPITMEDVPNIYVSVVLMQGSAQGELADYKLGLLPLNVDLAPKTLTITLDNLPETVQPGDEVSLDVTITEPDGSPARGTELSLDIVDKAVLSLRPRTTNILDALYALRALQVRTSTTLNLSVNRYVQDISDDLDLMQKEELAAMPSAADGDFAQDMVMEEAEGLGGGELMGLEAPRAAMNESKTTGTASAPLEVREDFADTALWVPTVTTDAQGRATLSVALPDNTTTWVVHGVGLTQQTFVGETIEEIVASKPLIIRPVAPRFLVVADRAQLAANVTNNTDTPLDIDVALIGEGYELDADTPAEQVITIPARQESKVTWWVTALDVPTVNITFSASAVPQGRSEPVYTDASKPRLTTGPEGSLLVYRYTAPDIVGTAGQIIEGGARTEGIALPPNVDTTKGELRIQLDPSLAAGMIEGLDYLEHFPYECTEQTVSRFLPNVLTYRAMQELGIDDAELAERLPALIDEGLGKLYAQQNPDGGWGWWHDVRNPHSNVHISAYVVFALLKTQEVGYDVDSNVLQSGLHYLQGQVQTIDTYDSTRMANQQAWLLYVLKEGRSAPDDIINSLYEHRDKLSHYGRAYLAQTLWLDNPKDNRLNTLLSDLNNAAILSATGAHWEELEYDWWAMNTDTRSTAIILDTLTKLDPENALVPNVVRWLMVARSTGIWETTQETAWALIALTDWMSYTGELDANYDFAVFLNDAELDGGRANRETIQESTHVSVPIVDLLQDATNTLTVARTDGNGRLYYTAHLEVYMPVEDIEPANRGFSITRRYTLASCAEDRIAAGGSVNECPEVNEIELGDVIRVDLTISTPHDRYYVVVNDPLPAGGEAIDTGLATTSLLAMDPTLRRDESRYWWWWQWYSRSEMRDEKVVLFAEVLSAGTYEYSYTFRATLPGDYHVIPTVATEFYFPEVFGRSDGRLLTIGE